MEKIKSEWVLKNTTDENYIYLGFKDIHYTRFCHFHIHKDDVKKLIDDLTNILEEK